MTKWKSAVCGLADKNACPRGKLCNFLHVFRNPKGAFPLRDEAVAGPVAALYPEVDERHLRRDRYDRRPDPPRRPDDRRSDDRRPDDRRSDDRRRDERERERDSGRERERERERCDVGRVRCSPVGRDHRRRDEREPRSGHRDRERSDRDRDRDRDRDARPRDASAGESASASAPPERK